MRHELGEGRYVEDVLEALAHRLEHDGEVAVPARDLEQGRGPLPLLPQGLAAVGATPRQEEGPRRALAETRGEEGRATDLVGHGSLDVGRVEGDEVEDLTAQRGGVETVVELEIGQPQDDPVVTVHRLHVDAPPLSHAAGDRQRPRGVHLGAEGGVHGHAPVTDLVAKPLDDDRAVVGQVTGRRALLLEVGEEVVASPLVEPRLREAGVGSLRPEAADLSDEAADGGAELGRSAELVAVPEGQPAGLAGGRGDEHLVVGDVLDAPAARAEGEDVADPRLVDHLLVELADPASGPVTGGEEDAVQTAVGDRATARHGESLRSAAPRDGAGDAVPRDARAQLGEVLRRVPPGEHVEGGVQQRRGQGGEGGRPPHERLELGDLPLVEGAHGDDLLGEHVERVGRDVQGLDLAGAHPLDDDGRLDEVAAELRQDDPVADGSDLVAGTADPLQPGGDRRR